MDCIPCFMGQALRAGRIATKDEKKIKELLNIIGGLIKDIPMENTPPETARIVYQKISEITGVDDPYKNIKEANIKEALSLYPELKEIIKKSKNKLLTAIRIAIAGNVIDFGALNDFNIVENVKTVLKQDFAIFDFEKFKNELKNTESILYLGDNAGESVFDKILIEELNKPVIYAVREIPIINDVTIDDAAASGLNEVAQIISSGSTAPATILSLCNENFLNKFYNADMIISKGQGNYEGLSNVKQDRIFFMLMAKCSIIANDLQVKNGDIILKAIN
ncbi:DUF89 domain-containing protein [Desulfobacula sp.]|uniref:damage-control phosphatase ARMT1 family protein n=1 Tax=Desulfobacula sp. TaxID=2593537 RepID=UPI002602243E|nr:ARMT1-like domain-containing protein [Desulfobacula sp.]